MNKPDISIIVPVYNMELYLDTCLSSIQLQSFSNFEVLVFNDCSTDNSNIIIEKYTKNDKRFKAYKNKKNVGLGKTRNMAILEATGKYLLFVDSDDWIDEQSCKILFNIAETWQSEIVIGDYYTSYVHSETIQNTNYKNHFCINNTGTNILNKYGIFTAVWDKLWLREFVIKNNLQNDPNHYFEDIPFTLNGLIISTNVSRVNYPFYYYFRGNKSSITQGKVTNKHLIDRQWVMEYLIILIADKQSLKVEKPLKSILAKQIQPALSNLRHYHGENKQLSTALMGTIKKSYKLVNAEFFELKSISFLKKLSISISPKLYNHVQNIICLIRYK